MESGPQLSMVVSAPSDEHFGGGSRNSMSVTWPRALGSNVGGGSGGGLSNTLNLKGPNQINADSLGVAGGELVTTLLFIINYSFLFAVHNTVKTSFSRPLSKPRVRNPLTSLKTQNSQGISPPLSSLYSPIPSIGTRQEQVDSPTQLEQDFLASDGNVDTSIPTWGDSSFDEEYFSMIPEDTTLLNSSLTSSLSSLYGHKDLDSAGGARDVSLNYIKCHFLLI